MNENVKELLERILANQVAIFTLLKQVQKNTKTGYNLTNGIIDLDKMSEKVRSNPIFRI